MVSSRKTPGVYIDEENAFPNSVVEVATAIPVFIGYTETARRANKSLAGVPTRISSFAEYEQFFGGPPPTRVVRAEAGGLAFEKSTRFLLFHALRLFFDNGGGACWIVSVGGHDGETGVERTALEAPLEAGGSLEKEQEPALVVVPDAVLCGGGADETYSVYRQMLAHCSRMRSRFAILDVYGGHLGLGEWVELGGAQTPVVEAFRSGVRGDGLAFGAAYYPWLETTLFEESDVDLTRVDQALREEFAELVSAPEGAADDVVEAFETLRGEMKTALGDDLQGEARDAAVATLRRAHSSASAVSQAYRDAMGEVRALLNLFPPSGAIAGVYARTDSTVGVFKAPANTGMADVVSPAVQTSSAEQEDLNVPLDGKAVNAIRSFVGRGVLVWGARTLDANSLDWRYVNVRRTVIMLEQSIGFATEAYVFAPNTAETWTTVRATISNFLNNQWKAGALAGATPAEAYSVDVGLGSTMTANDILDGYMRVTVGLALVRPAEFIVVTFQRKMQAS